jgi:hypothetical protein
MRAFSRERSAIRARSSELGRSRIMPVIFAASWGTTAKIRGYRASPISSFSKVSAEDEEFLLTPDEEEEDGGAAAAAGETCWGFLETSGLGEGGAVGVAEGAPGK